MGFSHLSAILHSYQKFINCCQSFNLLEFASLLVLILAIFGPFIFSMFLPHDEFSPFLPPPPLFFKMSGFHPTRNFGQFGATLSKMSCRLRHHTVSIVFCVFRNKQQRKTLADTQYSPCFLVKTSPFLVGVQGVCVFRCLGAWGVEGVWVFIITTFRKIKGWPRRGPNNDKNFSTQCSSVLNLGC